MKRAAFFVLLGAASLVSACGAVVSFDDYGIPIRVGDAGASEETSDASSASSSSTPDAGADPDVVIPTHSVSGNAQGLDGRWVELVLGSEHVVVVDGPFAFKTKIAEGATYSVELGPQPIGRVCAVIDGVGRVQTQDVVDVRVECRPADATLKSLSLSGGPALAPSFAPATFAYTAAVARNTECATIEAVPTDALSTTTVVRTPAGAARPCNLDHGENHFDVIVTAADRATRLTYSIVITRDGTHYLKATNARAGARFGSAVAVEGNTIVVGAPGDSSGASGVGADGTDTSAPDAGAAYVFSRSLYTWSQATYVKASTATAGAQLGSAVALAGDLFVAGAPEEPGGGAAYVFRRNGVTWVEEAHVVGSKVTSGARFGASVAIYGTTVVVGAPGEDAGAGAAYAFVLSGSTWPEQARLGAANARAGAAFGTSVAIAGNIVGDRIIVGSPGETSAATGIAGDGSDGGITDAGAAYVFLRSGSTWTQEVYLKGSKTKSGGRFGASVAASRGDMFAVGWPGDDAVSAFVFYGGYNPWGTYGDIRPAAGTATGFGSSLAYYVEQGGQMHGFTGAPSSEAAYAFQVIAVGAPTALHAGGAAKRRFGAAIAYFTDPYMYPPSDRVFTVVGAPDDASGAVQVDGDSNDTSAAAAGAVYVF